MLKIKGVFLPSLVGQAGGVNGDSLGDDGCDHSLPSQKILSNDSGNPGEETDKAIQNGNLLHFFRDGKGGRVIKAATVRAQKIMRTKNRRGERHGIILPCYVEGLGTKETILIRQRN